MSPAEETTRNADKPLADQLIVIIGGDAGVGLSTARCVRDRGADVIVTGPSPETVTRAARELNARDAAVLDVTDTDALGRFFWTIDQPADHVVVVTPSPSGPTQGAGTTSLRQAITERVLPAIDVAHCASGLLRPDGSFLTIDNTRDGHARHGFTGGAAVTSAMFAFTAALAVELAPARANTIILDSGTSPAMPADRRVGTMPLAGSSAPLPDEAQAAAAVAIQVMTDSAITGQTLSTPEVDVNPSWRRS